MKRECLAVMGMIVALSIGWTGDAVYAQETGQDVAASEIKEEQAEIQEGYTKDGNGYTSIVTWCKNGDKNIYGKFYFPEGYNESKTYPTVIMSHGLGSRTEMVERALWPEKAVQEGYVVYAFDYCGGGMNSNSDGDYLEMSVMTEISDLNAVMDFVKSQPFVNEEQLFLLGQSQGGLVSALTAADRGDEVTAMVLVYPAFCIVDNLHEFIPDISEVTGDTVETAMGTLGANFAKDIYDLNIMEEISGYDGDVLLIHGMQDKTVPYTYSSEALEKAYTESASNLILAGGPKTAHGFEMIDEEARDYVQRAAMDFLNNHK